VVATFCVVVALITWILVFCGVAAGAFTAALVPAAVPAASPGSGALSMTAVNSCLLVSALTVSSPAWSSVPSWAASRT